MTAPIMNARLRPMIDPTLPPVTISIAMTSVYSTIAVWMPVIVVWRSSATVAIETFITDESRAIRNWAAHRVSRTAEPAFCAVAPAVVDMGALYPARPLARSRSRPCVSRRLTRALNRFAVEALYR